MDLTQSTSALLTMEQSLGEAILDMGLSQIYPSLMEELHVSNSTYLFATEGEALEAAMDRPNARVVVSIFGEDRRWALVDKEGNLVKPKGWRLPNLRPILDRELRVRKRLI